MLPLACPVLSVDWPLTFHLMPQNCVVQRALELPARSVIRTTGVAKPPRPVLQRGLLLMSRLRLLQVPKGWQLWRTFSALPRG